MLALPVVQANFAEGKLQIAIHSTALPECLSPAPQSLHSPATAQEAPCSSGEPSNLVQLHGAPNVTNPTAAISDHSYSKPERMPHSF